MGRSLVLVIPIVEEDDTKVITVENAQQYLGGDLFRLTARAALIGEIRPPTPSYMYVLKNRHGDVGLRETTAAIRETTNR